MPPSRPAWPGALPGRPALLDVPAPRAQCWCLCPPGPVGTVLLHGPGWGWLRPGPAHKASPGAHGSPVQVVTSSACLDPRPGSLVLLRPGLVQSSRPPGHPRAPCQACSFPPRLRSSSGPRWPCGLGRASSVCLWPRGGLGQPHKQAQGGPALRKATAAGGPRWGTPSQSRAIRGGVAARWAQRNGRSGCGEQARFPPPPPWAQRLCPAGAEGAGRQAGVRSRGAARPASTAVSQAQLGAPGKGLLGCTHPRRRKGGSRHPGTLPPCPGASGL